MRGGQNVPRVVNDDKYEVISSGPGSSQLIIKDVSISDLGYYVCDATVNVNQPSSAKVFLGVVCKCCFLINSFLYHRLAAQYFVTKMKGSDRKRVVATFV